MIASGTGQVVTARILTRQVSQLVELTLEDGSTLAGTPQHPIWSVERQDWAELGDLVAGEHLWTEGRQVEILATQPLTSGESVYNLEIHGNHVYQVTELGVLVHNTGGISNYKINKNSNNARGTFAIYEIYVDGTLRKVGKAAANAGLLAKNGNPTTLESQLRKLRRIYGKEKVMGTVIQTLKNSSTRVAKAAEDAQIAKRVAENV